MRLLDSYDPSTDRFVVFQARMGCGGLGDRVVGMLSAAMLAILTQRQFRVHWDDPFPLSLAWRPNHDSLPWDNKDYSGLSFGRLSLIDEALAMREWLSSADLVRELPDNIIVEANQHFFSHLLRNDCLRIGSDMSSDPVRMTVELLKKMFTPGPELAEYLSAWKATLAGRRMITLQIRTLWNFNDGGGGLCPSDLQRQVDCVRHLGETSQIDCVFVTSDDAAAIELARESLSAADVLSLRGPILHLDRSVPPNAWPYLELFLSLHALASGDELVISHWSNFGRLAAFLADRQPWVTRKEGGGCAVPVVSEDYRLASLAELISKDEIICVA